jgi:hypothetical protein
MFAFPKGRLDCCGKLITLQLYVNQCARTHIYGSNGLGVNGMRMDGTKSESVGWKIWTLFGGSIIPVVKHNTKSACKIQHLGLAG